MTSNAVSSMRSSNVAAVFRRRYDIDWLRVLAVLLLFFYHPARIFYLWDPFYIKNDQLSPALSFILLFIDRWHMPILFLLAGASTWYALQRRSGGQYAKERFLRLLVPFVFGVLVFIPPQIYFDLRHHNANYAESYWQFYPRFFSMDSGNLQAYKGAFDMGHLWFISFLFLFSLIALPILLYLRNDSGKRLIGNLAKFFARPGMIFLFFLPIYLLEMVPLGYPNPAYFITFFIYGYILIADERFGEAIDKHKGLALVIGPGIYAIWLVLVPLLRIDTPEWVWEPVNVHRSFVTWCSLIALLGYGRQFLSFTNRFLRYFGEASYPLYILHQTFVIGISYYVVQWEVGILIKLLAIITGSFLFSLAVYDILVKRTNVTRFLLGMRPLKKKSPVAPTSRPGETVA